MEIICKQNSQSAFEFEIHQEAPTLWYARINAPDALVNLIYHEAIKSQQESMHAVGFSKGTVPFEYIEQTLKSSLIDHVKDFLLTFCITSFLYEEIRNRHIVLAGTPRIHSIDINPPQSASFTFALSTMVPIRLSDWKYIPFKAPKRKNYKDLDRQVEFFIKEERGNLKQDIALIANIGDWINCDITFADNENRPILPHIKENVWLKLGDEDADMPLREIFINKEVNKQFFSQAQALQEYFSPHLTTKYNFLITIKDIVKNSFFCFEEFKRYFKIKTNKEINHKLIEVFSYRNDLSLHRSMAEETLKLMLSKYKFDAPMHCILRQQQTLLDTVKMNPDYHVYRVQKDFNLRLRQLAEKQSKEALLIDHIAYQDNIAITDQDVKSYLNLTQRQRMKEFLYFDLIPSKHNGREIPVSGQILKQSCLREKTLNHVIHHLTKK